MTTTTDQLTETLNDLVKINNDRITGYEKASEEAKPYAIDLQALFFKMAADSRSYVRELNEVILEHGGQPSSDTTASGKIYRMWMDVKNMFTGKDRVSILNSCEFGEDAAQKAYTEALESDTEMDADIRQLILEQKARLKDAHDTIKKYRDLVKVNS